MFLEKYHCDGIRVAATNYIRHSTGGFGEGREIEEGLGLIKEINTEIKNECPKKLLIAEDMMGERFVTEPLLNGGLGFDIQWDPLFMENTRTVLNRVRDEERVMQYIVDALARSFGNDLFTRIVYCESHREISTGRARLPEEIHPGNADGIYAKK